VRSNGGRPSRIARRASGQNARPFEGGPPDERPQRCDHSRSRVDHCWRNNDSRRNQGLGRRLGRSEHRSVFKRKLKFNGALKLLRLVFFPETARDVAERNVFGSRWRRCGINRRGGGAVNVLRYGRTGDRVLWLLRVGWRGWLLILACFQLSAIFRRKDLVVLQVIGGVNVLIFFLMAFFAGAFLTSGFGHTLIFLVLGLVLSLVLSAAWDSTDYRNGKNQENGDTTTQRAEGGLYGSQAADPGWSVKIRTCHCKPTETGDNAWKRVYAKRPFLGTTTFFGTEPARAS